MPLHEYSKFNSSPKIEKISSLVRLVGPDLLLIHRLILHSVGLLSIGKHDLNGFQNLAHLNLSGNQIINIQGLNHLSATLVHLDLSCNRITKIPQGCFRKLYNLRKLVLAFNGISSLETMSQVHGNQYKLEHLDLRNNDIKHLKNIQYLRGIVNLKVLLFQNADKTAHNPVCVNFHKMLKKQSGRRPPVNWRVYVHDILPTLQYLDQIQLSSVPSAGGEPSTLASLRSVYDQDLLNEYPEIGKMLSVDDNDGSSAGASDTDDDLNQLQREDEEEERQKQEKQAALPSAGGSQAAQQQQQFDSEQGQHPLQLDLPPPAAQKSASPIVPPRPKAKAPKDDIQKSQVFNNQFRKLGSFISRRKKPVNSARRRKDESPRRRPFADDSALAHEEQENNDSTHELASEGSLEESLRVRQRKNRKRKSPHAYSPSESLDEQELSDIESSASLPSFPRVREHLRSLPSVLSFAPHHEQPAGPVEEIFPNEEREKLIGKLAELSETLGTTNAYIQHREAELAQEVKRRRLLEDKISEQCKKTLSYKQKTKSFVNVVNDLKEHIYSLKTYQHQLETTIKHTNEEQEQLKQENDHLRGQMASMQQQLDKCENQLSSQKDESDQTSKMQATLQERQVTIQELSQLNETLTKDNDQLKKEVLARKYKLKKQEERHKRSLEQHSKLIDQQILSRQDDHQVQMQHMRDHYEGALSAMEKNHQDELDALRDQLLKEHQNTTQDLKDQNLKEVQNLRDQLTQLQEAEVSPREETILTLKKGQDRLKDDLTEAESTIETQTKQIQELRDYLKKYINQEIHSRATEDSMKEIIETQKERMKEMAARVKQIKADSVKREQNLQAEVETWQQKYETDVCALQSKLKMLSINANTKDKVIQKLEKKLERYTDNTDEIESKYKTQLEGQQNTIDQLKSDVKRLQTENDIKKHLIDDREDTIQTLKTEVEQLKKDNDKLEADLDYLDEKVERFRDAEAVTHEEASKKRKQIEELQLEQEEMSRLLNKEAQKRQRSAQQLETLTQTIQQLKEEIDSLNQSKQQLEDQCHQQDNTIHDLQHNLQRRTEQLRKLQEEDLVEYKQEIVNQQAQLKYLVNKVEKDREEKETLRAKLQKVRRAFEENVLGDD
uniref:Leucine-rich repeat and coiled-coil domain-containing protein 1 n=1 Tax=Percolomonas cosmopolitus TaxID=63605 RepID=A0A7S1PHE1_9EUKA|mmetsp:Transcript_4353/g.16407  ORF Transcript_4353/g.16407 Transcript_4353/m.16407 type:complete len:1122 (+) Transcript_4353:211-3576(+)